MISFIQNFRKVWEKGGEEKGGSFIVSFMA